MKVLRAGMDADNVKISVGISFRATDVNVEEQMHQADEAMYAEKRAHRKGI